MQHLPALSHRDVVVGADRVIDATCFVQQHEVVVDAGAVERLVPLHGHRQHIVQWHRDVQVIVDARPGIEIVHSADALVDRIAVSERQEELDAKHFAAVDEGAFVTCFARVARSGVVRGAPARHSVDRLCHDPVLEHGFVDVEQVIDDHVRSRGGQSLYRLRVFRLAGKPGVEQQFGARCEVMHDLQHRAALVDAEDERTAGRRFAQHLHTTGAGSRQVAARDVEMGSLQRVIAVGQDADSDARAIEVEARTCDPGTERRITLTVDGTGASNRRNGGNDRGKTRKRRRVIDGLQRQVA